MEQEENGEANVNLLKKLHDTTSQLEKEKMHIEMHYVSEFFIEL